MTTEKTVINFWVRLEENTGKTYSSHEQVMIERLFLRKRSMMKQWSRYERVCMELLDGTEWNIKLEMKLKQAMS